MDIFKYYNTDELLFQSDKMVRVSGEYEPHVYIIKQNKTNKLYIGVRTQFKGTKCLESDLGDRYFTSSKQIKPAWKSDIDEFSIVCIIPCHSNHDALLLEIELILSHNAVVSDYYLNYHCPGQTFNRWGVVLSDETKDKISISLSGYKHTKEAKEKMSRTRQKENNPFFGRSHTEETKKALSDKNKGRRRTPEQIQKMSEVELGEKNHFYGKTHTDETKEILAKKAKDREKKECTYCGKEVDSSNYGRWHGERCKYK